MQELIKIENTTIGDESVPTVSARELHEFLESKQDFSTWVKKRIRDYDFIENKDFTLLHKKMEQVSGSKHLIEYYISLDMAKELSMIERNEKGKQARKYFIECEKKLLAIDPETKILSKLLKSESNLETTLILKEYKEVVQAPLLEKVAQQQPKVDIYDAIIESKNTFSMANTAQIINIEKMGRNKLLAWLRAKDILKSDNTPYQKYINKGWFEVRLTSTVNGPKPCSRTTPKGIEGILRLMENC